MDPYHIIVGEINNVVSSMKLNVRYTSPNPRNSAKQQLENGSPLLRAFKNLQENVLYSHRDISSLDTLVYLKPFLNVIRSEETTGPITGVALTSVNKFLNNFITENSPNISKAIENVAEAVTHCRFEATDPDSDEVVLMKILQVLLSCIKSPVVVFLTEELILEMVQTCFRISSQIRLSELLRRTAENTLTEMIQALFIKLRTNPSVFDKPLQSPSPSSSDSNNSPRGVPSANNSSSSVSLEPQQSSSKEAVPHTVDIENLSTMNITNNEKENGAIKEFVNPQGVRFEKGDSGKPFGISCLIRLINFISGIIKLPSGESEEGMEYTVCLMGLNLSNTILEACGKSLQNFPPILKLIQETLSAKIAKCMISDDLQILSSTLRAFYNMFSYLGEHLKMQMELFFNSIIRIMEWKSVSYSQQEIILESVLNFCKEPDFMVNLYVNFDCDLNCSNLFENLCKFLYKNSYPVNGNLYATNLLSLDALLYILQSISSRLNVKSEVPQQISPESLRQKKQIKSKLLQGVDLFNKEPEDGLKYLQSEFSSNFLIELGVHLLPDPIDPQSIALFLRSYGVNKTTIGEYLGKNKEFNIATLKAYIRTFDYKSHGKFIDNLREFLENFRIPGEAQVISRILEHFGKNYFEVVKEPFASSDAVEILSYSCVMLNVDQHNKEVKNKMMEKDFIRLKEQVKELNFHRNVRGINGGKDFPPEMLSDIFQSIKNSEIKIAEEHTGIEITDSMWRQVLNKSRSIQPFISTKTSAYDQDLFSVVWGSLIASISVVFDGAYDENIQKKVIEGFNLCAQISAHYHLSDVLDNLVISLCKFSMLLSMSGPNAIGVFVVNKKAQIATQTVFDITRMHGDYLREGWKNILSCIITLNKLNLLPNLFEAISAFENSEGNSPNPISPTQQPKSILTSFWTGGWFGGTSEPQEEPPETDSNAEKIAKELIKECNIQEILNESKYLHEDSLLYLVKALIAASSKPIKASPQFEYKQAIFCLDMLTRMVQYNENRIMLIWQPVFEHFSILLEQPVTSSHLFDKAIIDLLHLSMHLLQRKMIPENALQLLKLPLKIDPKLAETASKQIIIGVSKLLESNRSIIQTVAGADMVLSFIEFSSKFPTSITYGFNMLRSLTLDNSTVVPANFNLWMNAVVNFTKGKYAPNVCIQSIELLHSLFVRASSFFPNNDISSQHKQHSGIVFDVNEGHRVSLESEEVWTKYWLPLLQNFSFLCKDSRLDVRNHAMTFLQRSLLSSYFNNAPNLVIFDSFEQIVFPLLMDLLKSTDFQSDPFGLEETRLRACALLAKLFLQYMHKLIHVPQITQLWMKILRFIKLYMEAGSDLLAEAVRESLKNVLLVMSASGIFNLEVLTPDGENLWKASWNTIGEFCPTLKAEFDEVLAKSVPENTLQQPVVVQNSNSNSVNTPSQVQVDAALVVNPFMNP